VLGVKLELERLVGNFRWTKVDFKPAQVELFLELSGPELAFERRSASELDLRFKSVRHKAGPDNAPELKGESPQHDRFICLAPAKLEGQRFSVAVEPLAASRPALEIAWCAFGEEALHIQGKWQPFLYSRTFGSLDAVAGWAREHLGCVFENAACVDGVVGANNCGVAVNSLLAYTLHSWLMDSWYVDRDGKDWFSVWEGSCYFHSTVDVEYTQTPFYLAVWPELLRHELDFWTEYSKDGKLCLGERGEGSLFLSHDAGSGSFADGADYAHDMEVEETVNYLLMAFAYYKRTGDESILREKERFLRKYLLFVERASSKGNGIPDQGVANTIDDASPAVQFGKGQVYLAVKSLAALAVGAEILSLFGDAKGAARCRRIAAKARAAIERKGWLGDHYATLLEKSGKGIVDPWSGKALELDEVPGWDASHIYTVNGLALLDMVGFDAGLDLQRLREDLSTAAERCMTEYGCIHSDYSNLNPVECRDGLAGSAANPGWISMNMLRDIAAFYRGLDFRSFSERYWSWQTTTNTQEPKCFFETFKGNNLCFYPRGIAVWGFFDALSGLVVDKPAGILRHSPLIPQLLVPRLFDADWRNGEVKTVSN
jgi:hypothetical protein